MNEKLDAILGGLCLVGFFLLINFLPELAR